MAGATSGQEVNDQSCLLDCCIEVNEYHVSVAVFFYLFSATQELLTFKGQKLSHSSL